MVTAIGLIPCYRVTLEIDVPFGDVTWQFSTKADGQGVSVSPVVAAPVGPPAETG